MKRGVTLVELLVVAAIAVTLIGLCVPAFMAAAENYEPPPGPPKTIQMCSVQHDGHWWVICRETFAHHPDCPCLTKKAEAE